MKQTRQSDHLSSSLTDLMTSLMVIFILLLVSRLNNQAGWRAAAAAELERRLQSQMKETGQQAAVGRAKDDPNTLIIDIPNTLITFDPQEAKLRPGGHEFLNEHIPAWAKIVRAEDIRPSIDNIVVEGHSDQTRWQNSSFEESKERNLALSQHRSMAVVSDSLSILRENPKHRDCFLEKLSATGRGEEDPADPKHPASLKNRRVVFKIRLRPELVGHVAESLRKTVR
ncbi:MAG: OmpA family protein [Bryobacteraceae bacterium]|nr:OmpA family protein [Bryobacteraceae bacterium]